MEAIENQVFNILTNSPGNLAYYVILAFTVLGSLQSSLNHYRKSGYPQGNRMVAGLLLLLFFQLTQFVIAGLTWQGLLNAQVWLPPIDRLVILLSLVCIVWLWLVPEPGRLVDFAFVLIFGLVLVFSAYSLYLWRIQPAPVAYNSTWMDGAASLFGMVLLGLGLLGLLIRRPNSWGIGATMFIFLCAGFLYQLMDPQLDSNYAAPVRLALLLAYPWLLALPQRFALPEMGTAPAPAAVVAERRRYITDIHAVQDFIDLLSNAPDGQLYPRIARSLSQLLLADYCLLVSPPGPDDSLTVTCGFNLIEEKELDGFSLNIRTAPMISNALKRGKPLRLPASSTSADLQALAKGLRVLRVGHLLVMPVIPPNQSLKMGVILLSPFSNRGWSREDQDVLEKFTSYLALSVFNPAHAPTVELANQEPHLSLSDLEESNRKLTEELEASRELLLREQSRAASLAELAAAQKLGSGQQETQFAFDPDALSSAGVSGDEAQDRVSQLYTSLPAGEEQVSRQAFEEVQANLRLALEQVIDLRAELSQLTGAETVSEQAAEGEPILSFDQAVREVPSLLDMQDLLGQPDDSALGNEKEISAFIQELRQPMASILGYTDLLLGESTGVLGELQRKFLERIRASVERLGGLADDLIQLTEQETNSLRLRPGTVVLDQMIDKAVAGAKDQLSAKNILLELNIPDHLPDLQADQQALQQVLDSLLQNAVNCTAAGGKVNIQASVEMKEHEPGYILVQVSDTSGGIEARNLPRVFSRVFKDDQDLDQGPCDQPVDLASVKALVEAHGGRIWVDSIPGKGSTFSMLLPLDAALESD